MKTIADLHIHSKYSRACSQQLLIPNIAKICERKGVDIVSTGDFTHPAWFKEIQENLTEIGNGLLEMKDKSSKTKFILGTEISNIYKHKDKTRRLHTCVFFPELKDVEKFIKDLEERGCNLKSDGRPIIGLSAKDMASIAFEINQKAMIIPAHAWTPWFSVFGSKSGYDSLEECFEELTPFIYSIETGLSSDPPMNWRLSALDNITLVSNSDAHSLPNLAREANVFDLEDPSYQEIYQLIKEKDQKKFLYTIEFYPEEGMYHLDGHSKCKVCLEPKETKKLKGICPKCKKDLIIGVLNRVDELADREEDFVPNNKIAFKRLVELDKIIAESFNIKSRLSKRVQAEYENILNKTNDNELNILMEFPLDRLKGITLPEIVEGIKRVRQGQLYIEPGYDGTYGKIKIFSDKEREQYNQKPLI